MDSLRIRHDTKTKEYLVVEKGWPRKIIHRAKTLAEADMYVAAPGVFEAMESVRHLFGVDKVGN